MRIEYLVDRVHARKTFEFRRPYGIAIAAESFHWMDCGCRDARDLRATMSWRRRLVLIGEASQRRGPTPSGRCSAVLGHLRLSALWMCRLSLECRGSLGDRGSAQRTAAAVAFRQSRRRTMSSCSTPAAPSRGTGSVTRAAAAFDDALREMLAPHARNGDVEYDTRVSLAWGRPRAGGDTLPHEPIHAHRAAAVAGVRRRGRRGFARHTLDRIDEAAKLRPDVIVTPEMTYPAYFLGREDLDVPGVRPAESPRELFAAKAREHGVHIAAGHGARSAGRRLRERRRTVRARRRGAGTYAKIVPLALRPPWFSRGGTYPVFETDVGRIGMLVCADGRLPEIARSLALNGAQIILDLTAWVSGGRRPTDLTSPQREYLMQTRAAENGVWIAAADKFGVEAESIVYCGGSCVIDPRGRTSRSSAPTRKAYSSHDVELDDAAPARACAGRSCTGRSAADRELPVVRTRDEPLVPGAARAQRRGRADDHAGDGRRSSSTPRGGTPSGWRSRMRELVRVPGDAIAAAWRLPA